MLKRHGKWFRFISTKILFDGECRWKDFMPVGSARKYMSKYSSFWDSLCPEDFQFFFGWSVAFKRGPRGGRWGSRFYLIRSTRIILTEDDLVNYDGEKNA